MLVEDTELDFEWLLRRVGVEGGVQVRVCLRGRVSKSIASDGLRVEEGDGGGVAVAVVDDDDVMPVSLAKNPGAASDEGDDGASSGTDWVDGEI